MLFSEKERKDITQGPGMPEARLKARAEDFISAMPYRKPPFASRGWGHCWHSLCSYHGKLKPAIAHFLISYFTERGDIVLDPLCGVGTIPFEACLQGRRGIGNDLSEMAYVVTKAKLEQAQEKSVLEAAGQLGDYIERHSGDKTVSADIEKYGSFGFNGKLPQYFHHDTFREILCARRFFCERLSTITPAEAAAFSAFIHVLHGNRPYALSRNSHPLTPYAPTGAYVYKNVLKHITGKIELAYSKGDFSTYIAGNATHGDFADISGLTGQVDAVICSPPFADSLRFHMQNWMRLWLCGWEPEDFKSADKKFLDFRQRKDFSVYRPFFETCHNVLKPEGRIILHLGRTKKLDMAEELSRYAKPLFGEVFRCVESVSELEKHGVRDKGATMEHQFLFLVKKEIEAAHMYRVIGI